MTKIQHSYMVWVGAEHYPTFDHLVDEIKRLGFSKRLPGAAMGRTLLQPGTVVYLAHDDGEVEQCKKCQKPIACPECRLRKPRIAELKEELKTFKAGFSSEEAIKASGFARRSVSIREKKIAKLEADIKGCPLCKGQGKALLGSGGSVKLKDGKTWDYRTYNYWMRQPDKFDAESVAHKYMCEECGGRGCLPRGAIHGAVLVDQVEYQQRPGEKSSKLHDMDDFIIISDGTGRRLSGDREPGGFYAVSLPDRNPKAIGLAQHLSAAGLLPAKGYQVHGSFVHFLKPVPLPLGAKRFRGVAAYSPKG